MGSAWVSRRMCSEPVALVTRVATVMRVAGREGAVVTLDRLDTEECDCAPSPRERRMLWPSVARPGALPRGALGAVTLGVLGSQAGPQTGKEQLGTPVTTA